MKLIEAMKQIKELQIKASDLRQKVKAHCADLDYETPVYTDQARQIKEWIQSHSDVLKEVLRLRLRIQKTNLATDVTIRLGEHDVTKCIAAWIHRRRDLANDETTMWAGLTDKNLKEGQFLPSTTAGVTPSQVKLRRYYDPAERDKAIELYRNEPSVIDRTLEVVNAVTDVLD
jgi:hypothetical protein